jgi:hypothetical protein
VPFCLPVNDMLDSHFTAAVQSKYIGPETVPLWLLDIIRLDDLPPDSIFTLRSASRSSRDLWCKGPELVKTAAGLQLELSVIPLYEDQLLFNLVLVDVQNAGFEMWDCSPGFVDHQSGRVL